MFLSLWHRFWNGHPVPSSGKCRRGGQHPPQPRLEPLEDRLLQAAWGSGAFAITLPPVPGGGLLPQGGLAVSKPPGGTTPIQVLRSENSPPSVINLGAAFRGVSGLQHADGLKLSILSNTNPGLVKPDLSEAALTLTYARRMHGTATIIVCATDADGVSVKQTILVTVRPLIATSPLPGSPIPARLSVASAPGTSR
jgi:hypothetical protein